LKLKPRLEVDPSSNCSAAGQFPFTVSFAPLWRFIKSFALKKKTEYSTKTKEIL